MAYFSFNGNTQRIWIQSSIKETNHLAPEQLGILDGPQTSEWTKEQGLDESLLLTR